MRAVVLFVAWVGIASTSLAQVIYEPVRSQYGTENRKFYYGGTAPEVIRAGAYFGLKPLANEPLRVYTDLLPGHNAARYGFTPDDARNEAYNAIPRYFRKTDLLRSAVQVDRSSVVPAIPPQRGTIEIRPYVAPVPRVPDAVIIIPKSILDKPLPGAPRA